MSSSPRLRGGEGVWGCAAGGRADRHVCAERHHAAGEAATAYNRLQWEEVTVGQALALRADRHAALAQRAARPDRPGMPCAKVLLSSCFPDHVACRSVCLEGPKQHRRLDLTTAALGCRDRAWTSALLPPSPNVCMYARRMTPSGKPGWCLVFLQTTKALLRICLTATCPPQLSGQCFAVQVCCGAIVSPRSAAIVCSRARDKDG